jgi:tRNA G18 (ribose-2'-O)-methylase SpoU
MTFDEVLKHLKGENYLVELQRLRKLIEILLRRQKDLIVFSENVKNEHNFSAIIRTCNAVGVLNIYYTENKTKYTGGFSNRGKTQRGTFLERKT